jgi:hypothetical protein
LVPNNMELIEEPAGLFGRTWSEANGNAKTSLPTSVEASANLRLGCCLFDEDRHRPLRGEDARFVFSLAGGGGDAVRGDSHHQVWHPRLGG